MTEGIEWPPRLLRVVRQHLEQVEHPEVPRIPPLASTAATRSVLTFLHDARAMAQERCGAPESVIDCCQNFVLDTIEQCCTSSFLSSKERRAINLTAVQRERRSEGGRQGPRRRRGDSENASTSLATSVVVPTSHKWAAVLPIEYLLRFFVALPSILAHYDKLGGYTMPSTYKQPLWNYVNAVLDVMKDMTFADPSTYVLLR